MYQSFDSSIMKILVILLLSTAALGAHVGSNSRIVGGSQATAGQFTYMVSIKRTSSHWCGGSIIDPTRILTAAHCCAPRLAFAYSVHAGIINNLEVGQSHNVDHFSIHASYNPSLLINDIAIIHLSSSIVYNNVIQPIRLSNNHVGEGVACVVSGWGRESASGNYPNMLKFVNLLTVSNDYCAYRLSHKNQPIVDSSICTYTVSGEGTCFADSGGPLASNGIQIGIVSWGEPCGIGYPDVYCRVSEYIDWIANN